MFKVTNKDIRTTPYFKPCSSVSIANFEQVNPGWDKMISLQSKIKCEILSKSQRISVKRRMNSCLCFVFLNELIFCNFNKAVEPKIKNVMFLAQFTTFPGLNILYRKGSSRP